MVSKLWSNVWKASSQKRKQRKYLMNLPLHLRRRQLSANLADDVRKTYGIRSFPVRTGDTVKIMAGQFKDQSGKVSRVDLARMRLFVENIGVKRADGTVAQYPLHASSVKITKLDLSDKLREDKLKSYTAKEVSKK